MIKYLTEALYVVIGVFILIINFYFISPILPFIVPVLNIVGGLIALIPPIYTFYVRYKTKKQIEQRFILFLRDLTYAINTGMTLPTALDRCSRRDYGVLTPYVNNLSSQVNWGIPFKKALQIFAKKTDSLVIKRAVTTIIETYKLGGKIATTLNAVGESLITIDKIRKERAVSVHAQIITSYLIFFVFIFILFILQIFLIPALAPSEAIPGLVLPRQALPSELYTESFINFIIIQGFFAGLATGKMAEGSVVAGIKHSVLLIAIGYTFFSFATQIPVEIF